ncbi:MAG: hypothetical protein EBT44_03190 [Actinobacteria bacterium]|uniref:Uncharacterized protein n=1 Tax=Candidatus Fonsibacter lacus TaxID=2576439 RepID=A0A965LL43_9PROT|nr:hypothetical protein [Candidatus Fonsibacter lacus]
MRKPLKTLIIVLMVTLSIGTPSFAALTESDAKYAQTASQLTQEFSTAIGVWGDTYQAAPNKFGSAEYKAWMKKAEIADINLYAPAIKKNDEKMVKKANDAILKATTLFSTWGSDFAKDSQLLGK